MRRIVRAVVLFVSPLLGAALPGTAGTSELLADINQTPSFGSGSVGVSEPLIPLGGRLVFQAYEPSAGQELWVSDGTPLGTRLIRDVEPGGESSQYRELGAVRQTALVLRDVGFGAGPWDLWRTDGTVAGTSPVAGLTELESCFFRVDTPEGVNLGNRLLFLARSPTHGCGLWKTDGTAAGTSLIESVGSARELVAAGNRVFFFTEGASNGLWTSNGDRADLLRSFETLSSDGSRRLTAAGSLAAFLARNSEEEGEELWISDGTAAGTRVLTRFFDAEPFGFDPLLKAIGNTLYFTADDGTGVDLWQSQAGAAPRRVTDFIHSKPFGDALGAGQLAVLGSRLIFIVREEGQTRGTLWVSGGTPGSTALLSGCPGGCPAPSGSSLAQVGSRLVFEAVTAQGRREPWVTDGSGAGTRRLADLAVASAPVALLGKAFFVSGDSNAGYALWKTDGTAAGTARLADLGRDPFGGGSLSGFSPVAADGRIYFPANLDTREPQLWVSDGTPGGTRPVTSLRAVPSSFPRELTPYAGGILFGAQKGNESSLWRSDGTAAGTFPVQPGINPLSIVPVAGGAALVLSRFPFANDSELRRTDGTAAGTFRIEPAGGRIIRDVLAPFGNGAVFVVLTENHRLSLWESDGGLSGAGGTHSLVTLPTEISFVDALHAFGPRLFFFAERGDLPEGEELWVSDGTAAGTRLVPSPIPEEMRFYFSVEPRLVKAGETVYFADRFGLWKTDGTSVAPVWSTEEEEGRATDLTELHGVLYFLGGLPENPTERGLWRTDGTPAGTFLVKAGGVPAERSLATDPVRMVALGDRLVYLADDGEHGAELWASDGTAAGTALVRDIAPGAASSPLEGESLTVAGGKVYFTATDGASGFELWESDGTAGGTRRVQDIAPGALSSSPRALAVSGNRLFFAADDGVHGEEPWTLSLENGGCVPSDTALCLAGRFRVEADWRDFAGNRGRGHAVALTADTGTFWFFAAANVEVILKVLDGRGSNGHHWVFYGALSNVEYTLTVTDTQSGAVRRYLNPRGWLGSLADTEAFGPRGASVAGVVSAGPASRPAAAPAAVRAAAAAGSCVPGAERLCLQGNRFAVEVRWKRTNGATGTGKAVALPGGDTGTFWFFAADNVELVVKVLDGRPFNGKLWVFFGALSDVEYTLTVTDTETGVMKTYKNPAGRLASVADTGAF